MTTVKNIYSTFDDNDPIEAALLNGVTSSDDLVAIHRQLLVAASASADEKVRHIYVRAACVVADLSTALGQQVEPDMVTADMILVDVANGLKPGADDFYRFDLAYGWVRHLWMQVRATGAR